MHSILRVERPPCAHLEIPLPLIPRRRRVVTLQTQRETKRRLKLLLRFFSLLGLDAEAARVKTIFACLCLLFDIHLFIHVPRLCVRL